VLGSTLIAGSTASKIESTASRVESALTSIMSKLEVIDGQVGP
jgi:hypothetical protein